MFDHLLINGVVIGSGLLGLAASRAVLVGVLRLMNARATSHRLPQGEDASPLRS